MVAISPTSSNAAALIFRVSVLLFEAKSHLHFYLAFIRSSVKVSSDTIIG